mgnify:CR=1 FL=1
MEKSKHFPKNKIRTRLILCFLLTTTLMGITNIFAYMNVNTIMKKVDTIYVSNINLNELSTLLNNVESSIEAYLLTNSSDNLATYFNNFEKLRLKAEELNSKIIDDETALLEKNIKSMIETYMEVTDKAVKEKRARNVNSYSLSYKEAVKLYDYINEYITKLNNIRFQNNTKQYIVAASNLKYIEFLNFTIIILAIVLNIILILLITYMITKPIIELSNAADRIAEGNFDVPQVRVDSDDEIGVMALAFNTMAKNIKNYITEIQQKAELESKLKEQELQNLSMKTYLKEAQLRSFQSQIDPHFLYNTLNAGVQLAIMEEADRTGEFIENVAELFRYTTRKSGKTATLGEEINHVENYIYILKTRFSSRLKYEKEIDESLYKLVMPSMLLQPIVENAFVHGLDQLGAGNTIKITVTRKEDRAEICISDNGIGMSEEEIKKVMNKRWDEKEEGGIGISNVINRMNLFYGVSNLFEIKSEGKGKGTQMYIYIPLDMEGEKLA